MKARFGAAIVLAALLCVSTAGCTLITPQATTERVEVGNGVNGTVGEIDVRNATLISENGEDASLLVTFYNSGDSDRELAVQYDSNGTKTQQIVTIAADGLTSFGNEGEDQLILEGIDTPLGALLTIFFQYGDAEGVDLRVPVLGTSFAEYKGLAPTPRATVLPTPTATTTPTPENTPGSSD